MWPSKPELLKPKSYFCWVVTTRRVLLCLHTRKKRKNKESLIISKVCHLNCNHLKWCKLAKSNDFNLPSIFSGSENSWWQNFDFRLLGPIWIRIQTSEGSRSTTLAVTTYTGAFSRFTTCCYSSKQHKNGWDPHFFSCLFFPCKGLPFYLLLNNLIVSFVS